MFSLNERDTYGTNSSTSTGSGALNRPFTFGERLGLVFITQAAGLSLVAVVSLLLYLAYSAFRNTFKRPYAYPLFRTHVDFYFVGMLISDAIQAIGGLLDIRWVIDAGVHEGALCTTQGMLKQIGDVGVALYTLTIAIHTFSVLAYRWRPPDSSRLAIGICTGVTIFQILIFTLGYGLHKGVDYYGNTTYWCWITSNWGRERIALEYVWMWTAAMINFLLYVPLFLSLRGNLTIIGRKWRWRWHRAQNDPFVSTVRSDDSRNATAIARHMLWYPLAYTVLTLPIAIVRWRAFTGHTVAFPWTSFAGILFGLSGLVNVLLFTFTRPALLPNPLSKHIHRRQSSTPNIFKSQALPSPSPYVLPHSPSALSASVSTAHSHNNHQNTTSSAYLSPTSLYNTHALPFPAPSTTLQQSMYSPMQTTHPVLPPSEASPSYYADPYSHTTQPRERVRNMRPGTGGSSVSRDIYFADEDYPVQEQPRELEGASEPIMVTPLEKSPPYKRALLP